MSIYPVYNRGPTTAYPINVAVQYYADIYAGAWHHNCRQ